MKRSNAPWPIICSHESTITIVSLFGDSELIVPDRVNVEIGGFDVLGDRDIDTGSVDPGPYAPTIKIRSFSMFGELKVQSPRRPSQRQ